MFFAFLRLLRSFWSPGNSFLRAPRARFAPAVEALEDRWLPSTIGGLVYFDANNNGIHDTGEQGIAGNTIQLYDSSGNLLATTVTNSAGQYSFSTNPNITPTAETQEVDATFAPAQTNNAQTQSVAQFNPALGTLESVEIIYNGTLTSDLKVENDDAQAATITGNVNGSLAAQAGGLAAVPTTEALSNSATLAAFDGTNDFAGTSGRDFGSQSNSGSNDVIFSANDNDLSAFIGTGTLPVTQTAQATSSISGAGNLLASVNTQSSGQVRVIYHYEVGAPLASGDYTVVQPSDPAGYVHGLETNDNVSPIPGSDKLNSIAVQLGSSDSLNNNFGERQTSSLSGTVYYDVNNNNTYDSGDQPLAGVTLNLSGTDDLGDQITGTTQTAADGSYQFTGLRAGDYVISEVPPAGYLNGATTVGNLGGTASGQSLSVSVPWSSTGTNYNFGEVKPPSTGPQSNPSTGPSSGTTSTPVAPDNSLMSKYDFIGGAWTKWGW